MALSDLIARPKSHDRVQGPVKCGPIRAEVIMTESGGIPVIILPGLAKAVLSREEAEGIRKIIDEMLGDECVVWAEEVKWEAVV